MKDWEFLSWIKDRLIYVYSENPNVDFIHRLNRIIETLKEKE